MFQPLFPLSNVEKQWAKVASKYVMVWQYCIGGRGGILNTIFKIAIIFRHWLSKFTKRKEKSGSMHFVSKNSNVLLWDRLGSTTLCHEHNDTKLFQNGTTKNWLSCYFFLLNVTFSYIPNVNQCLTRFFFQKLCVIGKISIRWSRKNHQTIQKVEM